MPGVDIEDSGRSRRKCLLQLTRFGVIRGADLHQSPAPDPQHLVVVDAVRAVDDKLVRQPVALRKRLDSLGIRSGNARGGGEDHPGRRAARDVARLHSGQRGDPLADAPVQIIEHDEGVGRVGHCRQDFRGHEGAPNRGRRSAPVDNRTDTDLVVDRWHCLHRTPACIDHETTPPAPVMADRRSCRSARPGGRLVSRATPRPLPPSAPPPRPPHHRRGRRSLPNARRDQHDRAIERRFGKNHRLAKRDPASGALVHPNEPERRRGRGRECGGRPEDCADR